jgi:predicted AlkP superfamily pyrophosphatase or phosphodiesterase
MILPDYKNSIVNLTSSILKTFGEKSLYIELEELKDLKNSENIILLLIDGLGYEYLKKYGKGSYLDKNCIKKLTSVFPSTTASAATSIETGVAPQQHGITGWFMYLKELGVVSKILPFKSRFGVSFFPDSGIQREDIFTEKRINDKIKDSSFVIYPNSIVDGKVNKKCKNLLSYKSLDEMFNKIKEAIKSSNKRKYIYSYYPNFDSLCHHHGCDSKNVKNLFLELDKKVSSFVKSLEDTNFTLLITADHGLIDIKDSKKVIYIQDHPELYDMLTLPLCGEPRVAYCYVRPDKSKQFEKYIKTKLKYCCEIYKSKDLLNKNIFGLSSPHKKLKDRIGDYILVMKDNYIIRDFLLNERKTHDIANHGGVSKEEMYVPLIRF